MKAFYHSSRYTAVSIFFAVLLFGSVHRSEAQQFSFGKNKVKYTSFNWRYIQSKHFDVYYYDTQNYSLAVFGAITLEASLKELQEDFGYKITKRIPIIIYDSHNTFAQTNALALPIGAQGIAGVTGPFKNRVLLPFMGNYDEFRSTLNHELVHAVLNEMFYGGNVQSRLSGNALEIPSWFNEGLAEYESKGWDTQTSMFMRDAVVNDYLPSLSNLGYSFLTYRAGESFWNYVVSEYGRHKITEILQGMKNFRSIPRAFKNAFGESIDEVSKDWQKFYKKRYTPEVAKRNTIDDFGDKLTKNGVSGTYNTSPAFSPQGDKIALITNHLRSLEVIVINAITGKKMKTLIKGNTSAQYENLKILKPNLSWAPDGSKIALTSVSKGQDQLVIVNYQTGRKNYIRFPKVDGISSVAWSPDGKYIAFAGHVGPYSDLFLYDLKTHKLTNLTDDVYSDEEPFWGPDSKTIYFASARGDNVQLGKLKDNVALLATDDMYTTDIYSLKLGSNHLQRLTKTPLWDEYQPQVTRDGRLVFISDENGIPNIYQLNKVSRTVTPLTNLLTGASQISLSSDGSRMAVSKIDKNGMNIYTYSAPFSRAKNHQLTNNHWANRRETEARTKRVPSIAYVQKRARSKQFVQIKSSMKPLPFMSAKDTLTADTTKAANAPADTAKADTTKPKKPNPNNLNFRNYVFSSKVLEDTSFTKKYLKKDVFKIENNTTDDDRYIPKEYRLKFTPDLVYGNGGFNTYYGAGGLVQIEFSDLLGNYRIAFGSNLQFDLRNSIYLLQFGNFKHRVNWIYSISHTGYSYVTYSNEALRYRYFTGGVTAQYPINRYSRVDFSLSGVSIAQDYTYHNNQGEPATDNRSTSFAYPQITYTKDKSVIGLITPIAGFRYAVRLSASPPITDNTLQFASLIGDFRKYVHIGGRYSLAFRGTAGASFGRDAQTYFLGGMRGWLNRKFSNATIPRGQFGRSFIAQPAVPMRGFDYFALNGSRFGLANIEFRFPLFAAILPGPIPILPLYNITGVAFVDAGMAWGQAIHYDYPRTNESYYTNRASLNFKIRKQDHVTENGQELPAPKGDILIGAGFGLRTIVFGRIPLRWDIGWPYYRDGFGGSPVNYISIGIDF
jgi:Tol biopolymer transport system component